jgi:LAS superfamily LD-carboxypeptidase LdcB
MLAAAEADGIVLSGGGYRSPAEQIAVRRANCGTSYYAIYQMPPSQCSPPTAIPGTSMHEQGLAIDFTYGGSIISSRSSPAFQWLAAHASTYGFFNLPSEPWHWSVNGN